MGPRFGGKKLPCPRLVLCESREKGRAVVYKHSTGKDGGARLRAPKAEELIAGTCFHHRYGYQLG